MPGDRPILTRIRSLRPGHFRIGSLTVTMEVARCLRRCFAVRYFTLPQGIGVYTIRRKAKYFVLAPLAPLRGEGLGEKGASKSSVDGRVNSARKPLQY